jgi:hypothetical protein
MMKYLKFSVLLKEIQPTSTNNILMEICDCFLYCLFISVLLLVNQLLLLSEGRRGRDHMKYASHDWKQLPLVTDKLYHVKLF